MRFPRIFLMRGLLLALGAMLVVAGPALAQGGQAPAAYRIGVVDVEAAVKAYQRYKDDVAAMQAKFNPRVDAIEKEETDWAARRDAAMEQSEGQNPGDFELIRANLAADREQIASKRQLLYEEMQRAELQLQSTLAEDVKLEISKLADEEGYHVILTLDSVLYADESLHVTTKLIDRLNTAYAKRKK